MNKTQNLLMKIKSGNSSWSELAEFLELDENDLEPFLNVAQKITQEKFGNRLKIFNPSKKFPAISITGSECSLECEHCNKKYLTGMTQILEKIDLENFLMDLSKNNGVGALISGGSDFDGSVPLLNFLDVIKKVKNKTNLIINTHTGLLNEETARKLAAAQVDIVSFDINMDSEIVKNIFHLDVELGEYRRAIELLKKYKLNVVPHICAGLYYGKLHKELDSIKFIKDINLKPSLIVLIVLNPPKNSKVKFETPKPSDIAKVIATLRFVFPDTEISLGCMRPRGTIKTKVEKFAVKAGITRIEIPSKDTLIWLKEVNPKIEYKFYSACCAIPEKYENLARSKDSDIKRYLNIL